MRVATPRQLGVMIVEDRPRARAAVAACISTLEGITVIAEASNGLEAIQMLETHAPDVVLMDLRMPFMGGLQATRILKKRWPHVKVVILSMYLDCEADAMAAGADRFLAKGGSLEELDSTIRSVAES